MKKVILCFVVLALVSGLSFANGKTSDYLSGIIGGSNDRWVYQPDIVWSTDELNTCMVVINRRDTDKQIPERVEINRKYIKRIYRGRGTYFNSKGTLIIEFKKGD